MEKNEEENKTHTTRILHIEKRIKDDLYLCKIVFRSSSAPYHITCVRGKKKKKNASGAKVCRRKMHFELPDIMLSFQER